MPSKVSGDRRPPLLSAAMFVVAMVEAVVEEVEVVVVVVASAIGIAVAHKSPKC